VIEPQYHVAHIQVTASPAPQVHNLKNSKAQNDTEAHKKILEIQSRLDNGEDFATVAMNWSEDPNTAANGGDLGNIPESGLKSTDPSTRDAVLKLKPGQYSQIIQIKPANGYRIVKLIDKLPAGQRDVNDPRVHQFIRDHLRQSAEQLRRAAFFEVVHNGAKIEDYYAQMILTAPATAAK
jgi:peptidyl-prolyl cis-trans isomerase SurA